MERGRLRPILSLKTPTETYGINPCNRNGSATTTAAKFLPFTTPQQPYFAQRLPNPAPPIPQQLDIGQTFPNPVFFHNLLASGCLP